MSATSGEILVGKEGKEMDDLEKTFVKIRTK